MERSERALTLADVAGGLALSTEAGWNQTADDWRYLLEAGRGFGVERHGALIATAMTLPYGERFGWISMVLVRKPERGRGIASALMERCIAALRAAGRVPVLDATPAGREVYRRLGFRDAWALRRLRRTAAAPLDAVAPDGVVIRALDARDLAAVAAFDRDVFGADRAPLLATLRERIPRAAFVARRGDRLAGFALARDGRTAAQVGPVVASDAATGEALVAHALGALDGAVLVDVPDRHASLRARLAGAGFAEERPFTRMLHERDGAFDRPSAIFAIAGPELG